MINKLFLDLNNFKPNLGSVERGDSIELNIKLLNDEDYSRSKFRLLGAKSDGKSVEQIEGLNLEEKDLKVVLEDQFVNCEGIVKLELNVVSGETEITTKEFYFFVSNTMNAEIIDSADSIPTLEKVSKYVDDAVNNLDALKEASEDITIINSEFKENEIKRKANEMLREKNEKARLQSEDIRITEEEEREANELERIKAENNRKVSESNRKVSENTRVTNERAREEAELSRQSIFEENEEIRNSNENLRIASEKERIKFNNKAKTDEVNRKEAETKRVEAEKTRVIAEDERKKAETSRQEAEDIRQNTYTNFNEAEEERRNNEISRQEAEALRIEAEKRRDDLYSQKEEERNAAFLESERTRGTAFNEAQNDRNLTFEESEAIREEAFKVSEAARNEAEEGRVAAELLRVEAEKLRVAGEENRNNTFTQSEEERKGVFEEAENARKVAESKRVKAENSRIETEKLRVTAETGRVEAESLRVTAEEGRVAAETKREEGFNAFEGKINANTEELKNARSATSGEKFNSLDERIDCEVDRLNKKIEVAMLQQEDKENHAIENTVEGITTDMVIKGRSLKNNFTIGKISEKEEYLLVDSLVENEPRNKVFYIVNNTDKPLVLNVYNINGGWDSNPVMPPNQITKLDLTNKRLTGFLAFYNKGWTKREADKETLRNTCIVLDREETYIPQKYFKGIKSFGQLENKISILSSGKNLFNVTFEKGAAIDSNTGSTYAQSNRDLSYFQKVPSNTQLILSGAVFGGKCLFNKNKEFIKAVPTNNFTTTNDTYYIRIAVDNTQNYNVLLEEETQATTYEPYKQDKKDILLSQYGFDEGLRGLGNVTDIINSTNLKAIKNIEKAIIDENNSIFIETQNDTFISFRIQIPNMMPDANYSIPEAPRNSICNKMEWIKRAWDLNDQLSSALEGYSVSNLHSDLYIKIKKDKLSTANIEGIKLLLKQWKDSGEPLILYYQLKTPLETPLDENIALKTFGERTYIGFENSISGTSSFKAPVNAAATISRLNRENRALEEENKNLRQDFESTTLTLTDSDLELVKQNVDMDFRLMEVESALDIPQSTLSSNINFKNKKGEVKSMARTPYEMMKIVILSGDYDREDYIHKVGKYYERGRMTKEEHDELMSLMTADEVISK